jgi:tetrahydromethanopterin S-methyltransferase subunit B
MYAFADGQRIFEEVKELKTILSQLEEPINRSATQLKDFHDRLEGVYNICSIAWRRCHSMV